MITIRMWPADYRSQDEKDAAVELTFRARVNLNVARREQRARIGADETFTPEWMLAPLPAVLRGQAA